MQPLQVGEPAPSWLTPHAVKWSPYNAPCERVQRYLAHTPPPPIGPNCSPMPRDLLILGEWLFRMSEVPLYRGYMYLKRRTLAALE